MTRRIYVATEHGEVLTEVAVSALTTDPEIRDIGRALIALARYVDSKLAEQHQEPS